MNPLHTCHAKIAFDIACGYAIMSHKRERGYQ
jgi:hypothetical protein